MLKIFLSKESCYWSAQSPSVCVCKILPTSYCLWNIGRYWSYEDACARACALHAHKNTSWYWMHTQFEEPALSMDGSPNPHSWRWIRFLVCFTQKRPANLQGKAEFVLFTRPNAMFDPGLLIELEIWPPKKLSELLPKRLSCSLHRAATWESRTGVKQRLGKRHPNKSGGFQVCAARTLQPNTLRGQSELIVI